MRIYQKLVPLCRHHHRLKQLEGWQLTQPEPGVLKWRTPSGRIYVTTPTEYPVQERRCAAGTRTSRPPGASATLSEAPAPMSSPSACRGN